MKPTWMVAAIAFLGATLPINPLKACSCIESTLAEAVAAADAVFVGKVVKLEVTETKDGVDAIRATLETSAVVKGKVRGFVEMKTDNGCCYCSFGFDIAQQYLLFVTETEEGFATSTCSRSAKLGDAREDLRALGLQKLAGGR